MVLQVAPSSHTISQTSFLPLEHFPALQAFGLCPLLFEFVDFLSSLLPLNSLLHGHMCLLILNAPIGANKKESS